ncbi:MAG: M28 family peptidase [Treponema sp.]|nr:M28 family peptidase [Treponema sp.]
MDFLPPEFIQYLAPGTDRCAFIQKWLLSHGVESAVTVIDGKRHVLVQFAPSAYNSRFRIKTIVAHYDRVQGSPGANDNSAADWFIMQWAVWLKTFSGFHNVRIFFTDGEELGWQTGVTEQGAFGIASVFRRLGIVHDDVYVFDSCGRGEVPVLAKTVLPKNTARGFVNQFSGLYDRAQNLLRLASPGRWMCLPVPYSDNASFLACGIPAVAITMLPADEATFYARELMADKTLEGAVMNRMATKQQRLDGTLKDYVYKERMPLTWRLFHTEQDNVASLTAVSESVMQQILRAIAEQKTLA